MKTIEIPNTANIYFALFDLINIYHTIVNIRSLQESYAKNNNPETLVVFNREKSNLDNRILHLHQLNTSLNYLSEFIKNRIQESQQIEIVNNKHFSIKEFIHNKCVSHYPNINDSDTILRIHNNALIGKYSNYVIHHYNNCLFYQFTTIKDVTCSLYFSLDYRLFFISWTSENISCKTKILNRLIYDKCYSEIIF